MNRRLDRLDVADGKHERCSTADDRGDAVEADHAAGDTAMLAVHIHGQLG